MTLLSHRTKLRIKSFSNNCKEFLALINRLIFGTIIIPRVRIVDIFLNTKKT
jgi:hypothetical protein